MACLRRWIVCSSAAEMRASLSISQAGMLTIAQAVRVIC